MRLLTLILLILALPPASSATHSLTYLGPLDAVIDVSQYAPEAGDCILGNRQAAVQYADYGWGGAPPYINYYPDGHSTAFFPWDSDCPCTLGYYFTDIHLVFASLSDTPVDIRFRFDLAAGARQDEPLCWLTWPWTEGHPTLTIEDTVPQPGYYELVVCATGWECALPDYVYGLTVMSDFSVPIPEPIRFALDATPDNPHPDLWWYHIGERLSSTSTSFEGDIIMWSDVVCCEFAVADEAMTWSDIKKLYGN